MPFCTFNIYMFLFSLSFFFTFFALLFISMLLFFLFCIPFIIRFFFHFTFHLLMFRSNFSFGDTSGGRRPRQPCLPRSPRPNWPFSPPQPCWPAPPASAPPPPPSCPSLAPRSRVQPASRPDRPQPNPRPRMRPPPPPPMEGGSYQVSARETPVPRLCTGCVSPVVASAVSHRADVLISCLRGWQLNTVAVFLHC